MPLYEYICTSCESKFELLRPMSRADDAASCPQCHNGSRRVLSLFASFSRSADGSSMPIAGGGSGCSTCAGGSCATCQ
ncbi:MAG: zinc ribbon domain-containing protein [Chloroflexi bacterium]|nr:zinc ribbon domain-containing protein [Chloroflexota bacterium]